MKRVLLVLVCAASFTALNAQVKFGIKAGANFANLVGDDAEGLKTKVGFNAGAQVQIPVSSSISVQPEAVISVQGAKGESDSKINLTYVNVPVMLTWTSPSGFFAQTGPQIGFLMSAKAKVGDESEDIKDFFKGTDFAWGFGLGFTTQSGFGVNGRFNVGLSKIVEGEGDMKNSVAQVGVFYNLGGGATASKK